MTKDDCEQLRREIKAIAEKVWELRTVKEFPSGSTVTPLPGEVLANVMLAYRHLEDASMRLGKAIQHLDGGTSVYDRTQVPGA